MRIGNEGVVTGTQVAYASICERKLWLYTRGIEMEPFSERVEEGRVMHILSYPRKTKEIEIPEAGVKIDFCEEDGSIHEVKLSAAVEHAHIFQLAYYLWLFFKKGEKIARGVIHYPKCRETEEVCLTPDLIEKLQNLLKRLDLVTSHSKIPSDFPKKSFCRQCAYNEFCFA